MDENLTTAGEPQVIESANTVDTNTAGLSQVQDANINDGSQVIESATPMDNNVTYNNVPDTTPTFDTNKDFVQNVLTNAVDIDHNNNLNANAGTAMDNFLNKEYNYDHNEAGTYWVAGAINDVDTQMSFLNTLIREEMYDEMDLQKYYYDTTMATARAYAASKERETAYGFYRAAQEKAIAEAQLTGWYMPAEGNYMLGQYTVAQNKLEDPDTSDEEKAKATRISNTVEKWFAANQIGTRGIKCLNMMNYEENVRHNTIMGELQKEANKISAASAAANAALANIQLREFKFQVEELELQYGYNFSKDIGIDNEDFLGHNVANDPDYIKYQALSGGKNLTEVLKNPKLFSAILGARNTQWLENALGEDNYKTLYNNYLSDLGNTGLEESIKNNGNILDDSYLNHETYSLDASNKEGGNKDVWTFHSMDNGKPVTRCYYKDGNGAFRQITDGSVLLHNGKKLNEVVDNFIGTKLEYKGEGINVGSTFNYSELDSSISKTDYMAYAGMDKKVYENFLKEESKGRKQAKGIVSVEHQNTAFVSVDKDGKYMEVNSDGPKDISKQSNILDVHINPDGSYEIKHADGTSLTSWQSKNQGSYYTLALKQGEVVGYIKRENGTLEPVEAYINSDNSVVYFTTYETGGGSEKKDYHLNFYTKQQLNEKGFTATKEKGSLNTYENNIRNYSNGYISTIKGKNQDTLALEAENNTPEKADIKVSNTSASSSTPNVQENKSEEVKATDAEINKIYIDMKDAPEFKGLTEEQAKEKIKENVSYYGSFLGQ